MVTTTTQSYDTNNKLRSTVIPTCLVFTGMSASCSFQKVSVLKHEIGGVKLSATMIGGKIAAVKTSVIFNQPKRRKVAFSGDL